MLKVLCTPSIGILIRDANGNHLYGFSPLDAAWLSNLQDNNAREAAIELLQNRGRRGIFTFETDVIKEYAHFQEAKGRIKEEWRNSSREYKDDIMPMFGKGQWHNVGLSTKDLAVIEICGMTTDDLCNAYGVSSLLFNNHTASTRDNLLIARKDMITSVVIPLLTTIRDGRNRKLNKDWNPEKENIVADFDQTIYTELEIDKKATAEWMRAAGCFTDNEIRVQLNFEAHTSPLSEDVWKKTTDVPMSMINENTITGNRKSDEQAV